MENKIGKILVLANNEKYIVGKQAVYMNNTYFLITKVTEDEKELIDEHKIVCEVNKDGKTFIKVETDQKVIDVIINSLGMNEEGN